MRRNLEFASYHPCAHCHTFLSYVSQIHFLHLLQISIFESPQCTNDNAGPNNVYRLIAVALFRQAVIQFPGKKIHDFTPSDFALQSPLR